jgi:hypothetical protein
MEWAPGPSNAGAIASTRQESGQGHRDCGAQSATYHEIVRKPLAYGPGRGLPTADG